MVSTAAGAEDPDDLSRMFGSCPSNGNSKQDIVDSRIYAELQRIAFALIRNQTLTLIPQPDALVDRDSLNLLAQSVATERNRSLFVALAANCIRRFLAENARDKRHSKHDDRATPLPVDRSYAHAFLMLDRALTRLALVNEQQANVVEMRYFGGMTNEEVAEHLGICPRTARRDWCLARIWLNRELDE